MTEPTALEYAYTQHIARAMDAAAEPGAPLFTVHLGAGALTLARYVEATRAGSPQLVVEFEPALYDAVVAALPLPSGSDVRVIFGDARTVADAALPSEESSPVLSAPVPRTSAAASDGSHRGRHRLGGRALHGRRPLGCRHHPASRGQPGVLPPSRRTLSAARESSQ